MGFPLLFCCGSIFTILVFGAFLRWMTQGGCRRLVESVLGVLGSIVLVGLAMYAGQQSGIDVCVWPVIGELYCVVAGGL